MSAEEDYNSYTSLTIKGKLEALAGGRICPENSTVMQSPDIIMYLENYADKDKNGVLSLEEYSSFDELPPQITKHIINEYCADPDGERAGGEQEGKSGKGGKGGKKRRKRDNKFD